VPRDWVAWHDEYDEPGSRLHRRLVAVQALLARALDLAPPGPIRLISMCAGQGRDVTGVLEHHPRAADVRGRLVELAPANASMARDALARLGIGADGVEVVEADAGVTDAYAGMAPADVVLVCGVFGNVTDDDIENTVRTLPSLCQPGATVLWTRHRGEPDLTPTIRRWFAAAGFTELDFVGPDELRFGVGLNRLTADPQLFEPGRTLFRFVPT
jgi:hypothetical protein